MARLSMHEAAWRKPGCGWQLSCGYGAAHLWLTPKAPQPSPHRSFGRLILPARRRACLVDRELGRHTPMASVLACAEADRAHRLVIATQ
ncbi:hypothetical protein HaLaN_30363 [Haematococcus lacustris]|uniref:Uncharacterized protein n=1 Tax=Haematococcus lacustris TaxID=44745 RepID=A0A6A0AEM6_HAELA|nr:hypothetical protein HaLaN_30363 [Haematococcus lacustris]